MSNNVNISEKEREKIKKQVKSLALTLIENAAYYSNFESKKDVEDYVRNRMSHIKKIKEEIIQKNGELTPAESRDFYLNKKAIDYTLKNIIPDITMEELEEMRYWWEEQESWGK